MAYKVLYKEVLLHEFYVEMDKEDATDEEVSEEFLRMASNSELDFSYGNVEETAIVKITKE